MEVTFSRFRGAKPSYQDVYRKMRVVIKTLGVPIYWNKNVVVGGAIHKNLVDGCHTLSNIFDDVDDFAIDCEALSSTQGRIRISGVRTSGDTFRFRRTLCA